MATSKPPMGTTARAGHLSGCLKNLLNTHTHIYTYMYFIYIIYFNFKSTHLPGILWRNCVPFENSFNRNTPVLQNPSSVMISSFYQIHESQKWDCHTTGKLSLMSCESSVYILSRWGLYNFLPSLASTSKLNLECTIKQAYTQVKHLCARPVWHLHGWSHHGTSSFC